MAAVAGSSGTAKGTAKGSKSVSANHRFDSAAGATSSDKADILDTWGKTAMEFQDRSDLSDYQKMQIRDAYNLGRAAVTDYAAVRDFISIRDGKGRLQASASVANSSRGHLYLELLATAPWNIAKTKGDDRVVRGAGTAAMVAVIKESVKRGYGGKVKLFPLDSAILFYEKLGFEPGSGGYVLSSEKAQKLLRMYNS